MNHLTANCLVVIVVFCLVQMVTPVPLVIDELLDYDTNMPVVDDELDLKEIKDVYDPTLLMHRFRRNMAQWQTGTDQYSDINHDGTFRRFPNRRHNTRYRGGGQLVDA